MTAGYTETAVASMLVAPLVRYALGALAIFLGARPLLRLFPTYLVFANPPLVRVCFYVLVLAALIVLV